MSGGDTSSCTHGRALPVHLPRRACIAGRPGPPRQNLADELQGWAGTDVGSSALQCVTTPPCVGSPWPSDGFPCLLGNQRVYKILDPSPGRRPVVKGTCLRQSRDDADEGGGSVVAIKSMSLGGRTASENRSHDAAVLVLMALLAAIVFWFMHQAMVDDAYITLAYIRELAFHGNWGMLPGRVANTATSPLNIL